MTDYKATPEQWAQVQKCADVVGSSDCSAILELRTKVEVLEDAAQKHIVETSANILALASRIEALEAVKRPASKVYEISKPLQLTPEQAQHVRDLLAPNSRPTPNSSQIGRSLVELVREAILNTGDGEDYADEARAAIREVALWLNEAPLDIYPGDRGIVVNALYDQANQ